MKNAMSNMYYITDREIYDFLLSAKQKITSSVLLELAKERGIFFSSQEPRHVLAERISLLFHDFYDLQTFVSNGSSAGRGERMSSFEFSKKIDSITLKDILEAYRDETDSEDVTIVPDAAGNFVLKYEYSDWGNGKNIMYQKQKKVEEIEIFKEGDSYRVRMPSTEKAIDISKKLTDRLVAKIGEEISVISISLEPITDPGLKIKFFTELAKSLTGMKYMTVTRVKVEADRSGREDSVDSAFELDLEDEIDRAEEEVLSAVRRVSLNGSRLLMSEEFKRLSEKKFYISSMLWLARDRKTKSIIEFEAGFSDAAKCTGFRYGIRGYQPLYKGELAGNVKNMRAMPAKERHELYPLVEDAAKRVLAGIIKESDSKKVKVVGVKKGRPAKVGGGK